MSAQLSALNKLERLIRRAFKHAEPVQYYIDMARESRGTGGGIYISHAMMRDILQTLDEIDRNRHDGEMTNDR